MNDHEQNALQEPKGEHRVIDSKAYSELVADTFASVAAPKEVSVTTLGMTSTDVVAIIDAIFEACEARGTKLKGIVVDAFNYRLPADAEYINATHRGGRLIIADINLNDEIRVRRA
jgi:hypothetical protein